MMTVSAMATSDMDTPTYPIICRESVTGGGGFKGRALSRMAKWVRWLHSQTVTEELERVSLLLHPSLDHCPTVRMSCELIDNHIGS